MIVGEAEVLLRPIGGAAFAAEADAESKAGFAKIESNASASGKRAGAALSTGIKAGALAFAAIGAASVDMASKFQAATANIAANADIPIAKAKQISSAFLGTMGSSIYSANTISNAYAPVAGQLGAVEGKALDAGQALTVMTAASNLAEATGGELASTTGDLAGVMQAYKLGVGQAADVTDVLFGTSRVTGVSVDTLATQLERLHSRLGDLTPSLAESGGLLNALAKNGVTGRTSMSALNGAFTTLLGGSKETDATLQQLGIHVYNSQGQFVGMKSVISQLQPVLSQYNQESQLQITKALFGTTANKQLLDVVLQGPQAYQASTDAVAKHGAAQAAADKQSQTFSHQVDVLKATVVDLGIKLGNILLPVLTTVAGAFQSATTFVTAHKAVLVAVAGVVGGILTTAFAVFTVNKMVAFKNSFLDAKTAVQNLGSMLSGPFKSILTGAGNDLDTAGGKVEALGTAATDAETTTTTELGATRTQYQLTGTSTTQMANKAKASAVEVGAAAEGEAAAVTTADTTIEAENVAAGASFTAMLGPIALVAAAVYALQGPISSLSKVVFGPSGIANAPSVSYTGKPGQYTQEQAQAEAQKIAKEDPKVTAAQVLAAIEQGGGVRAETAAQARAQKVIDAITKTSQAIAKTAPDAKTTGTKQYVPPETPAQAAAQAKAQADTLFGPSSPLTTALKDAAADQKTQAADAKRAGEAQAKIVKADNTVKVGPDISAGFQAEVAKEAKAAAELQAREVKAGQTELAKLEVSATSTSLASLKTAVNQTHKTTMESAVHGLLQVHTTAATKMAGEITSEWKKTIAQEASVQAAEAKKQTVAAQAAYDKMVTDSATAYSDLADGAATLSKASTDLGITSSATSTSAINAQLQPLGAVNVGNAAALLGPVIQALQTGPLSTSTAAGFSTEFGGSGSALGTDLAGLASGKLNSTQQDALTKATETLVGKMAALVSSVDKNTTAVTTSTGALGAIASGGSVTENLYARSPGSSLSQLDFQLKIGALPS